MLASVSVMIATVSQLFPDAVSCSLPPQLAAKLLQLRFKRDQGLAWKFELVRRREALARAEADAKVRAAATRSKVAEDGSSCSYMMQGALL